MASDEQIDAFRDQTERASEDFLFADAALGIELEKFISSPPGRFMVGRAREVVAEFLAWALSDQANASEFDKQRAKAIAARTALLWALEQIDSGRESHRQLDTR